MLIFDTFYYFTYRFGTRILKKQKDDVKESALIHLVVYTTFFIDIAAYCIGMINDNFISRYLLEKAFIAYLIIGVILFIAFGIRYYRVKDIEDIEKLMLKLKKTKYKLFKYFNLGINISIPILLFISFRLYKFGYV